MILLIDAVANDPRWSPRHGWHDDHRAADGTPEYLPALQQVRAEFVELLGATKYMKSCRSCLQLGMGECDASHEAWRQLFTHVTTIDTRVFAYDDYRHPGGSTHAQEANWFATTHAPYDLLFIDAGHTYVDVAQDHLDYGPMVSPGGLIVFHDALQRPAYPEVKVWRYLEDLRRPTRMIGTAVGLCVLSVN